MVAPLSTRPPAIRVRFASFLISALFVLSLFGAAVPGLVRPARAAGNPIVTENQQPGDAAWQLGSLVSDDATGQIKGYASATSVSQNQSITFYVTTNPAQTYSIDFFRMGWYGGLGARLRLHVGPLDGVTQPSCPTDPTTGMIACAWTASYTLGVPGDWTSGIYLGLLTNAHGYQNYMIFVVKDGRPAAFLYQESVTTGEAYNNYPDDRVTGKSLYEYNSYGANTVAGDQRAVKVSFDRPYTSYGAALFLDWEVYLVRWLERNGYDVTYSTDVDTHADGAALLNSKAFISSGHDEYWSMEMFNAARSARDAGTNLAFFGADTAFWQVRFESSAAGIPNRVMVCYKDAAIDPVQGPTTTVAFRDPPVNQPEQTLVGVQFTNMVDYGNNVRYVVTNSSNWVYAGTGFQDGDSVPGIVGYEMDRLMSNYPPPPNTSYTLLSHSPYTSSGGVSDYANSSIYQAPSGAWVFAAGSISWNWGLDDFNYTLADPRIQRVTANVLNAFLNGTPIVQKLTMSAPASATAGQSFAVRVTSANSQGNPVATYRGTVHFSSSDGQAVLPADYTFTTADAGVHQFSFTLKAAGNQTVNVVDLADPTLAATVSVTVTGGPAATLILNTPSEAKATQAFNVTVTLRDQFGNVATGFRGTVHFTSTDVVAQTLGDLPADYTFTSGDGGIHTFSVTLVTVGNQTITVADTANTALRATSVPITVSAL